MKIRILLTTVTLLSLVLIFSVSSVAADTIVGEDLEVFFDKAIKTQMEEFHIPGATLAVVSNGKIILSKGYGYADLNKRTKVDAKRTLFRIGSVSKLVTWTAVMQLVEQGKLDLNADINTYLDFKIPPRLKNTPKNSKLQTRFRLAVF